MTDRERNQWITREIGHRAYLIYRQPWRVIRNRRLRAEIALLMEFSHAGKADR